MKERPILFNGAMVRAILDGRKTQTRRPVKGQSPGTRPALSGGEFGWYTGSDYVGPLKCFFAPGDRLWVRETFGVLVVGGEYAFKADGTQTTKEWHRHYYQRCCFHGERMCEDCFAPYMWEAPRVERWIPAIHMPRQASRLTLEVTEVRVQRVEDITEADAVAEGFSAGEDGRFANPTAAARENATEHVHNARQAFLLAWRSIYGHGNPWVWAITFRRVP